MHDESLNGDFSDVDLVLFDLGGVLVDISVERALSAWTRETGVHHADWEALLFQSGRKEAMDKGLQTVASVVEEISEVVPFSMSLFVEGWEQVLTLRPSMASLVKEVALRFPTGLLSNTDPVHHRWARRKFLDGLGMHYQFVSYTRGAWKPEPEFYEGILRELPFPAHRVLFVDDLDENVEGARTSGMQAVRFAHEQQLRTELEERGILPGGKK